MIRGESGAAGPGDRSGAASVITGRGWYVPPDVLSTADIAGRLDDSLLRAWIEQNRWCQERLDGRTELSRAELESAYVEYVQERIGIRNRHVIDRTAILEGRPSQNGIYASELGVEASKRALADAGVDPSEVELIVCGTSSPDRVYPTTAIEIQQRLGATEAHAYDLLAACSSYAYAVHVARGLIEAGIHRRILVVSAEYFTAAVNYADPNNAFFWGDAAAATLIERADLAGDKPGFHVIDSHCVSIPSQAIRTGLGGTRPFLSGAARNSGTPDGEIELGAHDDPYFYQDGRQVYRDVVPAVVRETGSIVARNGLELEDVRKFWFHQPSRLVLDAITKRLLNNTSEDERVAVALEEFGNTSSCGAPLCLCQDESVEPGDFGVVSVFGAGYTIGLVLLRRVGH